jgi:hypothetical protein
MRATRKTSRAKVCPVSALATEVNGLITAWNLLDVRKNGSASDRQVADEISDRIDGIKDQASFTVPRSKAGAAFLLSLAIGEVDFIRDADENHKDIVARRCARMLRLALQFIEDNEPGASFVDPARSYFMGPDPRAWLPGVLEDAKRANAE